MPIIDDLNTTIENLMAKEFGTGIPFDISFAAPRRDFDLVSPQRPTVSFFLYDIREDVKLRSNEPDIERRSDGTVVKKQPPARIRLSYCVTAWSSETADAEGTHTRDEHRQLSNVLRALIRYVKLPPDVLSGDLIGQVPPLPTTVVLPDGMENVAQFWNAIDGTLKPFLDYRVTISLVHDEGAEGPMVAVRTNEYGQMSSIYALTIRPELQLDHRKGTTMTRAVINATPVVALDAPTKKGDQSITVTSTDNLSRDDFLMIVDGERSEFCQLGEIPGAGANIPVARSLLHDHAQGTELKRLDPSSDALGVKLAAVASSKSSELQIAGSDAPKIKMGEVLRLDDPPNVEYWQVVTVSGPRRGLGDSKGLVQFGGIVINDSSPAAPITGATVTLVDVHGRNVTETTSDSEGKFVFIRPGIRAGQYTLQVEAQGYKYKEKTMDDITAAKLEDFIISLEPG